MARLRGNPVNIDFMSPFAVESGGRVYDLSEKLHFEIFWTGSSIQERFTGDVLTGSGHSSTPGPASHTGFLVNNTGSFENLIPNISWANDEFTISFWVKFSDTNILTGSSGDIRQFDFLLSKSIVSGTPKFSTVLKKDPETTTGLRAYFGVYNFDCGADDLLCNFCDTNDNSRLIQNPSRDVSAGYDSMYPSENSRDGTVIFGEWSHVVLRSSTRKNGKNGVCDVWVNGKRVHRSIQKYQNASTESPSNYIPEGSGVIGENQLRTGGKIFVYEVSGIAITLDYPSYLASNNDRLYISNHSYYQIAKWNRILRDDEVLAIYKGTINGVYVDRKTSISSPPRKRVHDNLDLVQSKNYGYPDLEKNKITSFDDSKTIFGSYNSYLGRNRIKSTLIDECHLEMSGSLQSSVLQSTSQGIQEILSVPPFSDGARGNFESQDGSFSSSVVKIPIFSTDRNDNLQFAGRTDSRLARRHSSIPPLNLFSMFLSSSLYRHGRLDASYTTVDTGIAGTGFLYYSPSKRCWVEKRSQNENSRGVNNISADVTAATNAIEVNSWSHPDGAGGFIGLPQSGIEGIRYEPAAYLENSQNWYLSKLQVTGANQVMRQFTASPQLAYFTNNKTDLVNAGYESIGSPTVAFGAPFAPRYHAYDNETIKMKSFIDAPFLLKKAVLRIPVEIQRIDEKNQSGYEAYYRPAAYFNFETPASSPSTVEDFSGNGHVATLVNSASVSMTSTPGDLSGRGRLALSTNATSAANLDNMTITHASDLAISSTGMCVSLWISFKQQDVQYFFAKSSATGNDTEYYAFYDNSLDRITFRISDQAASSYSTDFIGRSVNNVSNFISDDKWHHVAFVYDGISTVHTGIKIYIDGVARDNLGGTSGTFTSPRSSTMNITVGSRGNSFADDYRGSIASLMFWNRQLDQNEISMLYISGQYSLRYKWDWTTNVTHRKDLDNYVFFLYRQRRASSGKVVDSLQDVSSSARFLIGSGSLCIYNSSSFGLSEYDGFTDVFGINTPIDTSYSTATSKSTTLNEMFRVSKSGIDPITNISTEKLDSPIHTPSVAINMGIESGTFIYRGFVEIEINPGYVLGGFPNNTLTYVTSSKGHMSTSFYSLNRDPYDPDYMIYNPDKCNRLFNWYPQKGTNQDVFNRNVTPPITTTFQNMWFGGTRQPVIALDSYPQYKLEKTEYTSSILPYYQFNNKGYNKNQYSELQNAYGGGTNPLFDIEIARTGLSIFTVDKSPFDTNIRLINDGRGVLTSYSKFANTTIAGVFQRTQMITVEDYTGETLSPKGGEFSVLPGISGSTFADVLSSMTVGYSPVSSNKERNFYNPYILIPEDELVLGLDAGITPPPDIAPYIGENLPDANQSGQHRPPQEAFINSILKESIWHYAGNSYLRILPGEADLLLYGDYVRDGKPFSRKRAATSNNISQIIGDEPVVDQFESAESDAFIGTYTAEIIEGSINQGTRKVVRDDSIQGSQKIHSLKRYVSLFNEHIVLADPYVSGVM